MQALALEPGLVLVIGDWLHGLDLGRCDQLVQMTGLGVGTIHGWAKICKPSNGLGNWQMIDRQPLH